MSNSDKCILSGVCREVGSSNCNNLCSHFIALHGFSGKGGRCASLELPSQYRLFTLDNCVVRLAQPKIYSLLDDYVKTFDRYFEESGNIKSLYLWSKNPGTGKTSTVASLLNTWLISHYLGSLKRSKQVLQTPAVFLDVNAFQTDYNLATMTNDEAAMSAIKSTIQRTQHAPFAVLDDIGLRSASESFRSYVHAIVNYRTANALPTVFTSNLSIEEMAQVFDSRLYDRMRDMCAVLHFSGESRRGKR